MSAPAGLSPVDASYPVRVRVELSAPPRNRLTVAFRPILAIPHLLLVGGPMALAAGWSWQPEPGTTRGWMASGGVLGAVAAIAAIIAWVAILFTGRYPAGLADLAAFYLRWRVRAVSYMMLLRDEYPPFGDGPYAASVEFDASPAPRDKLSVGFRFLLILPQLIALCFLGLAWAVTTVVAWIAILYTGRYPESLEQFAVGVLRWSIRVEAYALLLHDAYPPFSLDE